MGIFIAFFFLLVLSGLFLFFSRKKRFRISAAGNFHAAGKKVLLEKSLYNELIAAFNVFTHMIENLGQREREDYESASTSYQVEQAKYKLMTPQMEGSRLLFTNQEFKLVVDGLRALTLYMSRLRKREIFTIVPPEESRLLKKVFKQLEAYNEAAEKNGGKI